MRAALSVIFDLDGTLIDSLPDIHAAVNRLLASEGHAPMMQADVQSYVGDGAPTLIRRVMTARGMDMARHADLAARMVADYSARACEETTVYPHVAEALTTLRTDGCGLGICTNKPESATRAVLSELGLGGFFDVIVAGDTLPERKPDPTPLLHAARLLGAPDAVFVGDSEVDARTADAAALPFVLFTKGYLRVPRHEVAPVAEFSDYRELAALLPVNSPAG